MAPRFLYERNVRANFRENRAGDSEVEMGGDTEHDARNAALAPL